jgi:glycoside/pentoside/hexuronide:cation symporter, GPH family
VTAVSTRALMAFSSPAFALAALGLPIVVILPPLYAELGLGLTTVGTIFMVARFFDVVTDPLFGVLGDRFNTKWGRRGPAMVLGLPVLLLGVYLAFMPGQSISPVSVLTAMLVLYLGSTVLSISHAAWASELSDDYDKRSRIMGSIQFFALLGSLVVLLAPATLEFFKAPSMQARSEVMGWLILVSLPLTTGLAVIFNREAPALRRPQLPWREALTSLSANRPLRRLLLADLLGGLQGGINGSVHFFYIGQVLHLPQLASICLVAIFVTGLLCVPIFLKLSYRIGKHRALCWGAIQSSIATSFLFFLPASSPWLTVGQFVLIGINIGAKDFLIRSIMADVIDQDRVATGAERSALYYSMLSLTAKLGLALAVGIMYPILAWVGFNPAVAADDATITGVRLVVATAPTLVTICVAIIMWRFPIDRASQQALRVELESRMIEPATAASAP